MDYFESNRQNNSSHLELIILENSRYFACYFVKITSKKSIIFKKKTLDDTKKMRMNFYNHHNSLSFESHSIRVTFKICAVLSAQGIRATGFKRAQGNQHCAKFESHTNRVTFETNAIRMTSRVQAQ